jgi:hypothetical protein
LHPAKTSVSLSGFGEVLFLHWLQRSRKVKHHGSASNVT